MTIVASAVEEKDSRAKDIGYEDVEVTVPLLVTTCVVATVLGGTM
jgi:hypothetical protein